MKIVYLAGPYRGANPAETERNIRTAQRYAMALTEAGIGVYCPHLNTAHFDGLQPDSFFLGDTSELIVPGDPRFTEGGIKYDTEKTRYDLVHWPFIEEVKDDPETGKSHLAHMACCLMFLAWGDKEEGE